MSDHPLHTNKLNSVTAIKMGIASLLICGFIYGCSNAKSKNSDQSPNAITQTPHKTQAKQTPEQTDLQSPKKKKREITKNWKTFFLGSTNTKVRIHLLQHGQKYKKALKKFSQSKMAQQASATITGIKLTSDTTAIVSYTINIGGAPLLKNKTGKALYIDGIWKVDDAAFCGLIKLSGNVPEPCPGSSS